MDDFFSLFSAFDGAVLRYFEAIRSPIFTFFVSAVTFLGEGILLGGAMILLYWLLGKRAEAMLFTAVTSFSVNSALKASVARPRPYAAGIVSRVEIENPLVSTMDLGDTLSFPSGHVQSTSSALISESLHEKKVWLWALTVLLVLLIACSRLYLGVHYPTDLIGGLLIGIAIAVAWHLVFRYAYAYRYFVLMGVALILLAALPFAASDDSYQAAGLLAGAAFFLPLSSMLRCELPSLKRRLLRVPVGAVCAGIVFALTLLFPQDVGFKLLKWFLVTGAAVFLAPLFFKLLKI